MALAVEGPSDERFFQPHRMARAKPNRMAHAKPQSREAESDGSRKAAKPQSRTGWLAQSREAAKLGQRIRLDQLRLVPSFAIFEAALARAFVALRLIEPEV